MHCMQETSILKLYDKVGGFLKKAELWRRSSAQGEFPQVEDVFSSEDVDKAPVKLRHDNDEFKHFSSKKTRVKMSPGHYPEAAICHYVLQGLATLSSGPCVTGRIHAAFSSVLTCYSTGLQYPKGQADQRRREN
ncbi:hypothetical protein EYF80_023055 [Liparis tanakae]|uniref:Uncharacterized protein n=1 Tax=Liparis tanakae TaxID=230148 RepID=A0A4Z2HLG5_9TELE|nr:hypothetical protein EYF80_023055 [Liparis tanakae]